MTAVAHSSVMDVSIAVPVGPGHRPWLEHTLRSISAQSCKVGVALCAAQDSPVTRDIAERYPNIIKYTRFGADTGQSQAINEGWNAVPGRVYAWLNDDDMLHPDALQRVLSAFERTEADVVHGRTDILDGDWLIAGYGSDPVGLSLLRDNGLAQPSTFVRAKALQAIREGEDFLDETRHFTMDWDLWQRLLQSGAVFHALDEPLSITRWYDGTKTAAPDRRKYAEYWELLRRKNGIARSLWVMGNIHLHNRATYGRGTGLYRGVKSMLSAVRHSSGHAFEATDLQVFHFGDHAVQPVAHNHGREQTLPLLEPGSVQSVEASRVEMKTVGD